MSSTRGILVLGAHRTETPRWGFLPVLLLIKPPMALGDDVHLRNIGGKIAFSLFMPDGVRIDTGAILAIGLRHLGRGGPAASSVWV